MRKHEILAAIVEMRFVNCKLCDKAVYSKNERYGQLSVCLKDKSSLMNAVQNILLSM